MAREVEVLARRVVAQMQLLAPLDPVVQEHSSEVKPLLSVGLVVTEAVQVHQR
jgi:hypothetical protein